MALTRSKYRRVPELYTYGVEVDLGANEESGEPLVIWMQVLNPFEKDEAQHDAQVARSRLITALNSPHASEEREKVSAAFFEDGRDLAIHRLIDSLSAGFVTQAVEAIDLDPDWKERLEIMGRGEDLVSKPAEDPERKLMEQYNQEYLAAVNAWCESEIEFQRDRLETMSDEDLIHEYTDHYIERRGSEVALSEYAITEVWYAARVCDAKLVDGEWKHEECDGHRLRIWDSRAEVRDLPEDLQVLLIGTMRELNMSAGDARFSARQGSSSGSSPLPSEEAESTPSTPTETPATPPGTSPSPSATP